MALARAADLEKQLEQEKPERAQERKIFEKEKTEGTKSSRLPTPNPKPRCTSTDKKNEIKEHGVAKQTVYASIW